MSADIPKGLGVYLSRVTREWDAQAAAKAAAFVRRARIRHVALCSEALDGWTADHGVLLRASEVFREAGVQVWVYSLPGEKALRGELAPADRLADAGIAIRARGWILDAEESYRHRGATLLAHRERLVERASERVSLGVTFYGTPSSGPAGYPWSSITGWGWAGWQAYERAGNRKRVRAGLAELRARWGPLSVVPHLATYTRKGTTSEGNDGPARLFADLSRTCLDDAGNVDVPGCWLWQMSTTNGAEADVLASWAERVGW